MKQYQAAAYMRLSVASSRESESESISNQEKIIQYFVDGNPDIELVSRQIDDGYSGIVLYKPAYKILSLLLQRIHNRALHYHPLINCRVIRIAYRGLACFWVMVKIVFFIFFECIIINDYFDFFYFISSP